MHKWDSDKRNQNHNRNIDEILLLLHYVMLLRALSQQS